MLRFSTSGGVPGLVKVSALGLKLDCKSSFFFSMWRQRWWVFLNLSHDVLSALLQSFVWCETLRHLWYLLFSLTIPHLWLTVDPWYTGQKARGCFALQQREHESSSVMFALLKCCSDPLYYGKVAFSVGFFLASGSEGWSWWNQVTKFATFSPFFSRCISFPKSTLSFGSSLDKRLEEWCVCGFLNRTSVVLHLSCEHKYRGGATGQTPKVPFTAP